MQLNQVLMLILYTPHIPDKIYAFMLARTYYLELLRQELKYMSTHLDLYHAKSFSCDDEKAVVGTINLDFRSFIFTF